MPLTQDILREGELLAAIDLGSNSFHMVVARSVLGQLRIIDRLRETVRIGSGLRANGDLDPAARERALLCLARFGERIHSLPPQRVRAIATNTVRQLRNPLAFLVPAETALGHGIEVVSGREEARLIYLGVAHGVPPTDAHRLVIDIGGGSTEFIIGRGFEPLERESLQMGCIATTRRFFPDGKLTRKRWETAQLELALQFQQFSATYRALGWQEAIGSSGTAKAIADMQASPDLPAGVISREGLSDLIDKVLNFRRIDDISLPCISAERRPVIAGGLLVMQACFSQLGLEQVQVCETAMREGVLYDMLGRVQQRDPRHDAINAMTLRYGVDIEHAQRVESTALALFDQVADAWQMEPDDRLMLGWAACLHELGLTISHSQHQKHGAYVVANSDIDGFSRQEQTVIATLVRCQRRNIKRTMLANLPGRMAQATLRNIVLLRLAILLHRSHGQARPNPIRLRVNDNQIQLDLPAAWLTSHSLAHADLLAEREKLTVIGMNLSIGSLE